MYALAIGDQIWSSSGLVEDSADPLDQAMERYADGDNAAFGEIYDGLAHRLLSFLRRSTRQDALAEDLLQQAFLQMHRARGSFSRGASVVAWAYAIARNLVIDHRRKAKRRGEQWVDPSTAIMQSLDNPERAAQVREEAAAMIAALNKQKPSHRDAFQLVRVEGLSMAEAGQVLGASEGAIKVRVHRVRAALEHESAKRGDR